MIGLSTYSFFWQHSDRAPRPLTLDDMFLRTRELGVDLFQICDFAPLDTMPDAEVTRLAALAVELGLTIELGTKGIRAERLSRYLALAEAFGARLVRSMLATPDDRPSLTESESLLAAIMPTYEDSGVTLALETYEMVPTNDLVSLVESVAHASLGICLDPANTVAILEHPDEVVSRTAAQVRNLHVKDFAFTREAGWVGFRLEGAPLGTGLLDYDRMVAQVTPQERGINQVIEHWVTWRGSYESTAALENEWTAHSIAYLRSREE